MEQAMKTFTQQMGGQNNPFANAGFPTGNPAFSPGSPFPFPPPTNPSLDTSRTSTPSATQSATVDVPASKVEETPATSVKESVEPEKGPKKYGNSLSGHLSSCFFLEIPPDSNINSASPSIFGFNT